MAKVPTCRDEIKKGGKDGTGKSGRHQERHERPGVERRRRRCRTSKASPEAWWTRTAAEQEVHAQHPSGLGAIDAGASCLEALE